VIAVATEAVIEAEIEAAIARVIAVESVIVVAIAAVIERIAAATSLVKSPGIEKRSVFPNREAHQRRVVRVLARARVLALALVRRTRPRRTPERRAHNRTTRANLALLVRDPARLITTSLVMAMNKTAAKTTPEARTTKSISTVRATAMPIRAPILTSAWSERASLITNTAKEISQQPNT